MKKVIIGIDGGGSYTRVVVSDCEGNVLAYNEGGASSIYKDINAASNVQQTIQQTLKQANLLPQQVIGLVAGIAGLDTPEDLEWASRLTEIEELECPKWHINDTNVAHAGAFLNEAGIVAISGTGSKIFAINDSGKEVTNYDFHQYANSAARFLSYAAVYEIIAGNVAKEDSLFLTQVLQYFKVDALEQLLQLGVQGFITDREERTRVFGLMAPIVTKAAQNNSPLAQRVCQRAVYEMSIAIQMLGATFTSEQVLVTGIGSVVNDPYIKKVLISTLSANAHKQYKWIEPELPAAIGGILLAFQKLQMTVTTPMIERLKLWNSSR
ncbi:BadF/BadG/BcrA/BcrD ATPase family protein [Paenibacillus yanchengensis]|uniref:BadF/BadG/BcrA/BcrD ATPase family protein n=1 Tax=Paenibacillus yanchengensis TaxID=2035833 RepID=A0ABW4YES1_9BACL